MLRSLLWRVAVILGVILCTSGPGFADRPVVRVAVLKFGTVNWLLDTVQHYELDQKAGVDLDVVALAGKAATSIAFQSGDADMLVTDWVWAMRQRTKDKALKFHPYSRSLGALIGRDVKSLCDLKGRTVGVVGGAQDKSWLLLQALANRDCGFDLAAETETLFGAPPLMSRQLVDGQVSAVSTYWHFVAKLEAAGMVPIIRIKDAMEQLGIAPPPPLIGFVWDTVKTDPAAATSLMKAITRAGAILAEDDGAWDRLRPLMRTKTDAEFFALRDAYRAGIPGPWTPAQTEGARALYTLLAAHAGKAFTDQAGPFNHRIFPGH